MKQYDYFPEDSMVDEAITNFNNAFFFTIVLSRIFGVKRILNDKYGIPWRLYYWRGKYYA
jgi:hypothetical protein